MKRIHLATLLVCAFFCTVCSTEVQTTGPNVVTTAELSDSPVGRAFKNKQSDVQVEDEGVVTRILADDLDGSRHQRFIVRLEPGQTVLISHNIDIAPRINALQENDKVRFYGEYVWNEKGGTIHWTHHDPNGRHVAGWIKHNGRTYQ
jgi:hypothetical protein